MLTVTESDLELPDGRTLHYYDSGSGEPTPRTPVFWLHGTPNVGSPTEPLFAAAAENGLRWLSYDRPAYHGSSPHPGRDVASAAHDVASIANAIGATSFVVLGHSGGGPHALACAALLPDRVPAVVSMSAPAPHDAEGLDWFAGWTAGGTAEQQAAAAGQEAVELYLATADFDPESFTPTDLEALAAAGHGSPAWSARQSTRAPPGWSRTCWRRRGRGATRCPT